MAWYPYAVRKPLRENSTQGRIIPRAIILHTAVSNADSLFNFFQNSSELESHFYVRDDGIVEQYLDTTVRADANLKANDFAISIETWDGGTIRWWTPAQLEGITQLCDWLCRTHAIPRVEIPTWNGTGIGYHVMFGAPGPWTPVAKSCPGAPRIAQFPALVRSIQERGNPVSETWNPWTYKNDDALAAAVPSMVGKDAYGLLMRTCDDARVIRQSIGAPDTGLTARLERLESKLDTLMQLVTNG